MVYTPVDCNGKRLEFEDKDVVFSKNYLDMRVLGPKGTVKIKGKLYKIYGKQCSIEGCNCDEQIIEVK